MAHLDPIMNLHNWKQCVEINEAISSLCCERFRLLGTYVFENNPTLDLQT